MSALNRTDLLALVLSLLTVLFILIASINKNRKRTLQAPRAYEGIDTLMHRSSEEGKSLLIGLGEGFSGFGSGLADVTGLMVEKTLMNRVVFNDRPAQSFSSDGALACISHAIVHGAYKDALASELFRPEYNQLTGLSGFSGLAGILPELNRSDNAGLVLVGTFRPESLIIADLAERKNIPTIVASGSLPTQAAYFTSQADLALGEDYYLPAVGQQSYVQRSTSIMNWLRTLLAVGLVLAAILKLSGVIP
ncbi:MAG: DUF6754 domain-containing protein [Anaerolineaceae bacterium]|jgi:hypothetical protein